MFELDDSTQDSEMLTFFSHSMRREILHEVSRHRRFSKKKAFLSWYVLDKSMLQILKSGAFSLASDLEPSCGRDPELVEGECRKGARRGNPERTRRIFVS